MMTHHDIFYRCWKISVRLALFTILFPQIVHAYQLQITEVYFDGTNERIELANVGTGDFNDTLVLSGARTSNNLLTQQLQIPVGEARVIADDVSTFVDQSSVTLGSNKLSLSDTQAVNIDLLVSGVLLDSFQASQSQVTTINNQQTSFELLSGAIIPVVQSRTHNIISGYLANPGFFGSVVVSTGSNIGTGSGTGFVGSGSGVGTGSGSGTFVGTGGGQSGANMTGNVITGYQNCPYMSGILGVIQIAEINKSNGDFASFIELVGVAGYSGNVVLSGTLLSGSITAPMSITKDQRILLTTSLSGFHHSFDIIQVPLIFQQTGTIELRDTSGQLFDVVYVGIGSGNQSLYQSNISTCYREFGQNISPSPGFNEVFLSYLNTQITTNTVYISQGGGCSSGSGGQNTTGSGSNATTGLVMPSNLDIEITLVDYNPPGSDTNNERLGITLNSGSSSIDLSMGRSVEYDGKVFQFSHGVIQLGQEGILTENFRFVNSRPVCVDLVYSGTTYNTVCYDPSIHDSPYVPGQLVKTPNNNTSLPPSTSGSIPTEPMNIIIPDLTLGTIIYDPPGSDINNEKIEIISADQFSIDLSPFRIRINGRNKLINETINARESLTITKTRGLSNSKPTCVQLILDKTILDEKCYDPNIEQESEVETIIDTGDFIESTSEASELNHVPSSNNITIKIHALIPNPIGKDTANQGREELHLLLLSGAESLSLHDGYKLRINGRNKILSGVLSLGQVSKLVGNRGLPNSSTCVELVKNDLILDKFCYAKPKEGYVYSNSEDSMEQLSEQILAILKKIKHDKSETEICSRYEDFTIRCTKRRKQKIYKASSNELRLARKYISILEQELKNDWYLLRSNSSLVQYATIYRDTLRRVKKGQEVTNITGIPVRFDALELQHTLLYNRPSEDVLFERITKFVLGDI